MTLPTTYEAARLALFDESIPEEINGPIRSVTPPLDEDFDEDDFDDEPGPATGPTFVARLDDYDDVHSFVSESFGESLSSIGALRAFYDCTLAGSLERRGERYVLLGELFDQDGDARGWVNLVVFGSPEGIVVVGVGVRLDQEHGFQEVAKVPASTFYKVDEQPDAPPIEGEWYLGF